MPEHLLGRYDPAAIRAQVSDHPLAAIGVAFIAGLAAGARRGRTARWVRGQLRELTAGFASTLLIAVATEGVRTWNASRRPPAVVH